MKDIQPHLFTLEAESSAVFSDCRLYRYTLWRKWGVGTDYVQFIGLNPSKADEFTNDPTLRRCIGFAKSWGYSGICMTNLFGYRATLPNDMKNVEDPIGKDNDMWLKKISDNAGIIIAAWGIHGTFLSRETEVKNLLDTSLFFCLGKTKTGQPLHPLYLKKSSIPQELD